MVGLIWILLKLAALDVEDLTVIFRVRFKMLFSEKPARFSYNPGAKRLVPPKSNRYAWEKKRRNALTIPERRRAILHF
jgi:hypothetical protein